MGEIKKLSGLWKNTGGKGLGGALLYNDYSADAVELLKDALENGREVRFLVFKNKSEHAKSPDYDLCVVEGT